MNERALPAWGGVVAQHDRSRRRFLSGLAAVLGATGLGALGVRLWGGEGSVSTTSTVPRPTTTAPVAAPTSTTATMAPPATSTTSTTSSTTTQVPAAVQIAAICRDAWGALPASGTFTAHRIERLTVHHTAALLEQNAQAPARIRRHQQHHLDRGWPDLAYHFMVDAAGNVYEGRPVDAVGDTGTAYDPTGHFLVCCEGNFDEQDVPDAQLASLAAVLAWAAVAHDVALDTIRGHRDWAATSCPGDRLYPLVADGTLARMAVDVIGRGGAELTVDCGDAARQRVAAIEEGST